MRFGFLTDQDATRYCYLRLRRLKEAIKDDEVLDALIGELEVPREGLGGAPPRQKLAAIERQIERLRDTATSVWHDVPAPEILAASIFKAEKRAEGVIREVFSDARDDRQVDKPVITWLKGSGLTLVETLPPGTPFDLVGYRKGFLSGARVVAIAVKNDLAALVGALDAMPAFAKYASAMYLACTPALAAAYLSAHAAAPGVHRWDAEALQRRLRATGIGLLLVEEDAVAQVVLPKNRLVDGETLETLVATVRPKE